jgi:hypothetical protein
MITYAMLIATSTFTGKSQLSVAVIGNRKINMESAITRDTKIPARVPTMH